MGLLDKTHDAMFRAIHIDRTLKGMAARTRRNNWRRSTPPTAPIRAFVSSMQSFAVATQVNRAKQYLATAFANGDSPSTPAFVVDGKYRVTGKTLDDVFRILNQLIVAERAKRAGAPAPAAPPAAESAQP